MTSIDQDGFAITERKTYWKKKRIKRKKKLFYIFEYSTYSTKVIVEPGFLFMGKHMWPLANSIKKSKTWFYKFFYIKMVNDYKKELDSIRLFENLSICFL